LVDLAGPIFIHQKHAAETLMVIHVEPADRRDWVNRIFGAVVAAGFIFGGATVSLAETKAEPKAESKADPKGGKGDAVIESELRKALLGKSALTGELLMKTGDESKSAPAKSAAGAAPTGKDAKDGKSTKDAKGVEPAVGKKMAMPGADKAPAATSIGGPEHVAGAGHDQPALPTKTAEKKLEGPGASHGKAHWGYSGAIGPEAWSRLSAEFGACAKGRRQSPIDLVDRDLSPLTLEQLKFDYAPAAFQVVHNGHTIEVRPARENQMVARGKNYKLLQFHFHHPSEERFNGKSFALDAHFVHRAEDGELAVVTVLFDEGGANPELQRLWDYMPLDVNDTSRSGEGVTFNPLSMLPADRAKYLQYIGSLTTPPCTEGVVWIVLRQPVPVSAEQIALFRKMVGSNARPVQPVNGRLIKASN
jgi:carbonic anhydrase